MCRQPVMQGQTVRNSAVHNVGRSRSKAFYLCIQRERKLYYLWFRKAWNNLVWICSWHPIQTDNGGEFTHTQKTKRIHPFDSICVKLHITHKLIRPRTPWHNDKSERSHRSVQERFCNHLSFYSYEDLQTRIKRYLYRSNNIPMSVPCWISPNQKQRKMQTAWFSDFSRSMPSLRQKNQFSIDETLSIFPVSHHWQIYIFILWENAVSRTKSAVRCEICAGGMYCRISKR